MSKIESLDQLDLSQLRKLLAIYEDRLAAFPPWRWLARWVMRTAVNGVRWEIIDRMQGATRR